MRDPLSSMFGLWLAAFPPAETGGANGWRLQRAPEATGFEWALAFEQEQVSALAGADLASPWVDKYAWTGPFLNFCWSDAALREGLDRAAFPLEMRLEGSLRDAQTAATLRHVRQSLKGYRKRLGGLAQRLGEFPWEGGGAFSEEMRLALAGQWQLLYRIEGKKGAWSPAALVQALEQYLLALGRLWDRESIDVGGNPAETSLRLRFWAAQQSTVEALSRALLP